MDAHGVEVLHVADGDAVIGGVAHHLVLDLLPAQEAALQQHLIDGRGGEAGADDRLEVSSRVGDAAAGATQRIRGPHDQGQAELLRHVFHLGDGGDGGALRQRLPDIGEELPEQLAVLGAADRLDGGAEDADAVLIEHAGVSQGDGEV